MTLFDPTSQNPPEELDLVLWDRIDDVSISESERVIFIRIRDLFAQQNRTNQIIYINVQQGDKLAIAWQWFQIDADDLESSDDPDGNPVVRSVLTTNGLEDSKHQFNWMQAGGARRHYSVVLGPGDGVPSHHVIIDRDNVNQHIQSYEASAGAIVRKTENSCRPYGMAGTKLQFGYWAADGDTLKFWPTSIAVDTFCYLEQQLPMVVIT